jgi:hypothetical protein
MFKLNHFKALFLASFAASLALTGCGQPPVNSQIAQSVVSDPPINSVATLIQGTYMIRVTQADLPIDSEVSTFQEYLGNWQLKLGEAGAYSTMLDGQVMSQGRYYFVDKELVFSESRYSRLCPTTENNLAGTSGSYDSSFEGDGMTLKVVAEDCAARSFLMQVHHLTVN